MDLSALGFGLEIIAVDDCSTDRTADITAAVPGVHLIRLDSNGGKRRAVRSQVLRACLQGGIAVPATTAARSGATHRTKAERAGVADVQPGQPFGQAFVVTGVRAYERRIDLRTNNPMR